MASVERTPISLLERLRLPTDNEAWSRFVHLYTPLMFFWARRAGLQEADAGDLVQDVFAVLVQKMPAFVYEPGQSFRNWLRTILMNKLRERLRRPEAMPTSSETLAQVEAPVPADFLETQEEQKELLHRALACLRVEFQAKTWEVFRLTALAGEPPEQVALQMRISVNAVYIARCRVMHRLREELAGLLPE